MYGAQFDDISRQMVMAVAGVQPKCPKCGGEFSAKVQQSFQAGQRVKCGYCDFYGNWRYGTLLEGSRLNNTQFLALFFKYTLPGDAPAIAKQLGLDPGTVREWRERLVQATRA
jgi:predicted RNA-binding Zn-ribbon protein involved in translation (DUF1610 family)